MTDEKKSEKKTGSTKKSKRAFGLLHREKRSTDGGKTVEQTRPIGLRTLPDVKFYNKVPNEVELGTERSTSAKRGEAHGILDNDKRDKELKRAFEAFSKLPTGEISRIADTAERRTVKWPDDIPKAAPELYEKRPADEKLPDFLRRVYGGHGYLQGKMTIAHFDVLDSGVAEGIRGWLKRHGSLPKDIVLIGKTGSVTVNTTPKPNK